MKDRKRRHIIQPSQPAFQVYPKAFVFFDRASGTKRFEVKAGADGSLPFEETVSLLAMQCVVRGQTPADFRVMVSIDDNLMHGLVPRTRKLIEACMSTVLPMDISQRQQEVLRGVLQNLTNKEIAAKLYVAERTVKFHVSALLQKFHVAGRVGLMRKTGDLLSVNPAAQVEIPAGTPAIPPPAAPSNAGNLHPKLVQLAASERRAGR